MASEIYYLHWTTGRGHRKGDVVLQTEGLFVYKTLKKIVGRTKDDDLREMVYAEIPYDMIKEVVLVKTGVSRGHYIRLKIDEKHFHTLLKERHNRLYSGIVSFLNKKHFLYFPVMKNTVEEIKHFVHLLKERIEMKKEK